jgi:hypothetical protein
MLEICILLWYKKGTLHSSFFIIQFELCSFFSWEILSFIPIPSVVRIPFLIRTLDCWLSPTPRWPSVFRNLLRLLSYYCIVSIGTHSYNPIDDRPANNLFFY